MFSSVMIAAALPELLTGNKRPAHPGHRASSCLYHEHRKTAFPHHAVNTSHYSTPAFGPAH